MASLNIFIWVILLGSLITGGGAAPMLDSENFDGIIEYQWMQSNESYTRGRNLTSEQAGHQSDGIRKRGISVRKIPNADAQHMRHPWPKIEPDKSSSERWVRYCFRHQSDSERLYPVLARAIGLWYPAYQYSSMRIRPDPRCDKKDKEGQSSGGGVRPDFTCICNDEMDGHALSIFVGEDGKSSCSLGWDYSKDERWRHQLSFGHMPAETANDDVAIAVAAMTMAHELGHAIGLEHEHQRPDARTYLDMNYRNFKQYGDCARDLQEYPEDPNFGIGWGVNLPYLQKMDMITRNERLARRYFPEMRPFTLLEDDLPATYKFDERSIMIYSSGNPPTHLLNAQRFPGISRETYQGGHWDPTKASISVLDIRQVAQLYPKGVPGTNLDTPSTAVMDAIDAMQNHPDGWGTVEVDIAHLWTRDRPLTVQDSRTQRLPRPPPVVAGEDAESSDSDGTGSSDEKGAGQGHESERGSREPGDMIGNQGCDILGVLEEC
ncbi:hypothetical protein NU219Hw_g4655t2 [Hortaea werneckii]